MQTRPPYIRCLVSYYNFLDISRTIHHSQFESPETVRAFSPVTHLAPDNPPMLVVRAGRDEIPALNESIATFVARAVEVNAPLTLMIHPTAPHGFENKQDDARTREILSSTIEFLKRHLDAPK
jgi:dipeptidyl aminopeptidase/acylaminoacyl peptidase